MTNTSSRKATLFQHFLAWTPRRLFLVDALGALLTTSILGFILPHFAQSWGIPRRDLYFLAGGVLLLFFYSISIFLIQPRYWLMYLRIIAGANFSYCLLTLALLWHWRQSAQALAYAYFIGEALVIFGIALLEWRYGQKKGHKNFGSDKNER